MAFILPFVGYYSYKLMSLSSGKGSLRTAIAAGIGAYLGILAASVLAGVEFGIQPILYHTSSGQPLYCPYSLNVAVPVMLAEHLLLFGWIEAVITFLVVRYLQKEDASLIR